MDDPRPTRRDFLELTALALGAGVGMGAHETAASEARIASAGSTVALVSAPLDRLANAPQVQRAIGELRGELGRRGLEVTRAATLADARDAAACIVVSGEEEAMVRGVLARTGVSVPRARESLALVSAEEGGRRIVLASGHDVRGLMYSVLELADRVRYAGDPLRALELPAPLVEQPYNAVRAIGRPFVSDVEDMGWFRSRDFWPAYFGMLARQRVNRFHLLFGMGYDTLRWVKDAYLLFAYPFLVSVPGHDVRAVDLPDEERARNLETLRFISREAVAHGLDFQLGLWTHGYAWADSPDANYTIRGLGPANHGVYCRDALAAVLEACPDITGVTLRTHYESGVKEGSYAFWKTIFDGVPGSGRRLEIELHAKGLDRTMIDGALSTGMPVQVSAKYWAEHVGLPYHQTAIRELELPKDTTGLDAFSALSFGSRNHTRYGHADFLLEDRPYGVMYRVFPGTHKFLLWGDPLTFAAHARAFRFCGTTGAELFEPLGFKGRRGSGIAGGRCGYADASLTPARDWEKFLYTYVLWGRMLYNPDTAPETWRRLLDVQYGAAAPDVEAALASATRILPIVTTAHLPSAAQDTYSPEFYTNQSVVDPKAASPYGDTPEPKDFLHVSPLDPQVFSTIDEYVGQLISGARTGKYSPVEAAQWVEDLADGAAARLDAAERQHREAGGRVNPRVAADDRLAVEAQGAIGPPAASGARKVEFRRAVIDIRSQIGMGRFFGAKLRSGALYAVYERTGDRGALEHAVRLYRQARDAWAGFAHELKAVYVPDITFGPLPHQRGHWADRVPAMDADIAVMQKLLDATAAPAAPPSARVRAAIAEIVGRPVRPPLRCEHEPPAALVPGAALELTLTVREPASPAAVLLHYRHVNQAERYGTVEMLPRDGAFRAAIPGSYTDSPFPMQYYFEIRVADARAEARTLSAGTASAETDAGHAWLYPGLNEDLANAPYFVVRRGHAG
jgi:hypothetical protein